MLRSCWTNVSIGWLQFARRGLRHGSQFRSATPDLTFDCLYTTFLQCDNMLKHVHSSSSSLSTYRCSGRDNVSVTSLGSSGAQDPLSSRSSSSSSLHEPNLHTQKVPLKIYARVLCSDIEYKTISVGYHTTSKEVVRMLLGKFKMKHRDPNLFYLTMEVWVRKTGIPIQTMMVLDDEACPIKLQSCHPHGESKFSLQMKRGGLVKVYDSCLMAGSMYKSLLVSERTTAEELIQLLLHCYNSTEMPSKFSLYELCFMRKYERKLNANEQPLRIQQNWPLPGQYAFQLRRNPNNTPIKRNHWLFYQEKPLQQTRNEIHLHHHQHQQQQHEIHSETLHSSQPVFNDYENYFYI
ncbi:uncharacterized protein [Centruroides vittatus]|uniref:uncharacterized protein isoform X1 n=2 Tax=Centruroides vittatus TaxID=120091 RepID=UPI00350FED43